MSFVVLDYPDKCPANTIQRPIALETPTAVELQNGDSIQVTLFDANHCPGSVMFCKSSQSAETALLMITVFEKDSTAVLYTGDIRSEPWFVNSLIRNPFLIEYTIGLKTLDCIYLDTSNTENIAFPSQTEGLVELVDKVLQYPSETVFHFSSWTFGYEKVWLALSKALKSQVS